MATWETTFYYQQELRSTYMNNLINGLIRPGIYNMDASIYTQYTVEGAKIPGIYLRINPGAILVFSNNYKIVNNARIRDDSTVGTYLIKCVLKDEADIALSTISSSGSATNQGYLMAQNRIPISFVTAMFNYDPEGTSSASPSFELILPSHYRESGDYPEASLKKLPNEDLSPSDSDERADLKLSYLILGALIDKSVPFGGNKGPAYANSTGWISDPARIEWTQNHVFTGRAFPEYRESVLKNYGEPVPSLGFSPYYKNMFLTPGQFYYEGTLYSVAGTSWKEIYGQGVAVKASNPNSLSGSITDGKYNTESSNNYTEDNTIDFTNNAGKLVVEFLFMGLQSEYSRGGAGEGIYPSLNTLFTSNDIAKKLLPFRIICDDPGTVNFNTLSTDVLTDIKKAFPTLDGSVIPLDVSVFNIRRLKKMLTNKNIVLKVIDLMRQLGETQSPFLTAPVGDSLLPLMVSFRKINAEGTGYEDAASSHQAVADSLGNKHSAVNPSNVLSFFELQSSGYTIQSANTAASETYTTLPFLGE